MQHGSRVVALFVALTGCVLDRSGVGSAELDAAIEQDGGPPDAMLADSSTHDAAPIGPLLSGTGSFSRPSPATYVRGDGILVTAGVDAPRERTEDGIFLRLIEGSATNLILHSESQATGWTQGPSTVVEDGAVAPDGSMSADRVVSTAFGPYQELAAPTGALTLSLWTRAGESPSPFRARYSWDRSGFGEGLRVAGMTGSSWVRSFDTAVQTSAPTEKVGIEGRAGVPSSGDPSLSHDVWLWGWQLEAGEFASSYIPSGPFAGVRSADRWEYDEPSISPRFASAPAVVRLVFEWNSRQRSTDAWVFSCGDDGLRVRAGGTFDVVVDGVTIVAVGPLEFSAGEMIEIAYDPSAGNLSVRIGADAAVSARGGAWSWSTGPLRLGAGSSAGEELYGWVSAPQ